MKILIVTQYFWPEEFRINDLAIDLVERGHDVTVLTGNPNYPQGKFYKGYGFRFSSEDFHGVKVYRVPIIARGNASGLRLAINYLSFLITSVFFALFHKNNYDKIFAVNFSPITSVFPAVLFKKLHKLPMYLWVQDLWPESVTAAGKINSSFLNDFLTKMVKYIYRNSDKVLVQSEAFIPSVTEKGVRLGQLRYVPNWAEDLFSNNTLLTKSKFQHLIPQGFIVMFAGNIGEAQDFNSIIKAAVLTKHYPNIKWIVLGDGRKRNWVESEVLRLGLQSTVLLLGRYPVVEMPNFFVHADLMLLTLKDEEIFALTIPSKVQSYMASSKPLVGMLNGIGAKVINDAHCGYVTNAGNYESLAANVISAFNENADLLSKRGSNGKMYYDQYFSKKVIIDNLIEIFQE